MIFSAISLVAMAVLAVFGVHRLMLTVIAWRGREPDAPALGDLPVITVQLPLYDEAAVAGRLIDAVAALDWPADRLEVQVLDDSTDETSAVCAARVAALRARGIDAHHVRRADRAGFKAGALEAGRRTARGELLLVLDADFVPSPSLLRDVVGHFADSRVGLVQVRWEHLNRAASPLTHAQALLLDGHFGVEQAARAWTGRVFNFNGTAGVWRAAAIADAGGWHADTLTEDLDLSYRAALRGWRFVYRRALAAPAELPATMRAFKSQQYRWAKGSAECARKLLPSVLRGPLPWRSRIEGALHLTQNLAYLALLALMLLALPAPGHSTWHLAGGAAGLVVVAAYTAVAERAVGRSALAGIARLPVLLALTAGISFNQARAVISGLAGRRSPFVRTPKDGGGVRRYQVRRDRSWIVEASLAAMLAGAAALAVSRGHVVEAALCTLFATGCAWVAVASAR